MQLHCKNSLDLFHFIFVCYSSALLLTSLLLSTRCVIPGVCYLLLLQVWIYANQTLSSANWHMGQFCLVTTLVTAFPLTRFLILFSPSFCSFSLIMFSLLHLALCLIQLHKQTVLIVSAISLLYRSALLLMPFLLSLCCFPSLLMYFYSDLKCYRISDYRTISTVSRNISQACQYSCTYHSEQDRTQSLVRHDTATL